MKIFTNVIASPVRAKQSIFGRLVFALVFACIFIACGDESGSSAPAPDPADGSSSSVAPTSSDDDQSSSSQKSSGKEKSSSSVKFDSNDSQKSSSSVSGKNSSSSEDESSSSEGCPFNGRNEDGSANLTVNCCNGDTAIVMSGKYTQYYTCRDDFWLRDSIGGQDTVKPYISHPNMEKQFSSKIDYETFVDDRDGQEYKIVTIKKHFDGAGGGVDEEYTFFAENLNLGKQILANATEFSDSVVEKVCYNDDEWYCDNGFGGMYTWSEAMNVPKKYDTVAVEKLDTTYFNDHQYIQGICPEGWHIMEEREWRFLKPGHLTNSRAVWGGGDSYGFSLLPVGHSFHGNFYGYGEFARAWLPSLSKRRDDWGKSVLTSDTDAYIQYDTGLERYGYQPIRCTKDY